MLRGCCHTDVVSSVLRLTKGIMTFVMLPVLSSYVLVEERVCSLHTWTVIGFIRFLFRGVGEPIQQRSILHSGGVKEIKLAVTGCSIHL